MSESSDDENSPNNSNANTKTEFSSNGFNALFDESDTIISTQQLMSLCSGQFYSQESQSQVQYLVFIP